MTRRTFWTGLGSVAVSLAAGVGYVFLPLLGCWSIGRRGGHVAARHGCWEHLGELVEPLTCLDCGKALEDDDRVKRVVTQCSCYDKLNKGTP